MSAKHTPGPWRFSEAFGPENMHCGFEVEEARADFNYRGPVARLLHCEHIGGITLGESEANARLISAAPDMLAALSELVANLDGGAYAGEKFPDGHPMHAARAAIAKATGEAQ